MRNAKDLFEQMRADDPALQKEYARLGPRFKALDAVVKARKRLEPANRPPLR